MELMIRSNDKLRDTISDLHEQGRLGDDSSLVLRRNDPALPLALVKELHLVLKLHGAQVYLHDLISPDDVELPEVVLPPRSPELEARVAKLKAEQENREYARITKNVGFRDDGAGDMADFGRTMKEANRHLVTVFNFVVTVIGAFVFVYKATEYALDTPNVPMQLCNAVIAGTLVFFADLYFILKTSI